MQNKHIETTIRGISPEACEAVRKFLASADATWTWHCWSEFKGPDCIIRSQPKDPEVHFDYHAAGTDTDFWTEWLWENVGENCNAEVTSRVVEYAQFRDRCFQLAQSHDLDTWDSDVDELWDTKAPLEPDVALVSRLREYHMR